MRIEGRFLSKQISRIDGGKEGDGETFVADAQEINKYVMVTLWFCNQDQDHVNTLRFFLGKIELTATIIQ